MSKTKGLTNGKRRSKGAFARMLAALLVAGLLLQPLSAPGYASDGDDASAPTRLGDSGGTGSVVPPADADEQGDELRQEEDESAEEDVDSGYTETVEIADAVGLLALAQRVNGGDDMCGALVVLTADIALDADTIWVPIGESVQTPFAGTFDGGGFLITGIDVGEDMAGGLFGYLYEATVQNVYLKNAKAPNSVDGLYFSAVRTTITDCAKKWGLFGLFSSGISLFSGAPSIWDGTARNGSLNIGTNPIKIMTAADLAQIAYLSNTASNDFAGKTILLQVDIDLAEKSWTPIGGSVPFKGHFEGSGCIIFNLKASGGGLFKDINDGSVNNLVIDRAQVTSGGSTGILAATSDSLIAGVVVKHSAVNAGGDAAGIVSVQNYSGKSNIITQCVVMNTDITAGGSASGIVNDNYNHAVTQCAVYSGTLQGNTASGIAYLSNQPQQISAINQNLVLGTAFEATTSARGIIENISSWNTTGNSFVSDVTMTGPNQSLGTTATPNGLDYYFTDSRLPISLMNSSNSGYTSHCFWDRSTVNITTGTPHDRDNADMAALAGLGVGHGFFTTSLLTNGAWKPNDSFWDAQIDYYPYLKYLMESSTPYMQEITGLGAVAVLLDNPDDSLDGARQMRLPKQTAAGDAIYWDYPQGIGIEKRDAGSSVILYTYKNEHVKGFELTAYITVSDVTPGKTISLAKHFTDLTLLDSLLDEDVDARHPATGADFAADDIPSLTFRDPIVVNASARGWVRLYAKRANGSYTLEKTLPCDSVNIAVSGPAGGPYKAEFPTLGLVSGGDYRLVIPQGAIEEIDDSAQRKGNFSEEITLEFTTTTLPVPVIEGDYSRKLLSSDPLSETEVRGWFSARPFADSGDFLHHIDQANPARSIDTAQRLTAPITDPAATLATLPAGVHYYIDPAILANPREPGVSIVHVFAVSTQGMRARRSITIDIDGLPEWDPDALPPALLHTSWTSDKSLVQALVTAGARAYYAMSRGGKRLANIVAEIDAADWSASQQAEGEPAKLIVTSYMIDSRGNRVLSDPKETVVYLDRVLKYTFNTAPLRYKGDPDRSFDEWKTLIEEDIAFVAINFAPTANVRYHHDTNHYAEEKSYTVYLETDRQDITLCDGAPPCSHDAHDELKDRVSLEFTVRIYDAEDPLERAFWEKIGDEILQSEFNDAVVRRPRLNYVNQAEGEQFTDNYFEMPAEICEMLRLQPYNTLELHYSAYKWKFYGHALTPKPPEQKLYPLRAYLHEDLLPVRRLIGKDTPAVLVTFDYVGLLNGQVEFSYDLRLAGGLSKEEIRDTDFYLYRYARRTGKLIPVSDVIVSEDGWASAVLTRLENAEYVFTDSRFGGKPYAGYIGYGAGEDDEPTAAGAYYHHAGGRNDDLVMFDTLTVEEGYGPTADTPASTDGSVSMRPADDTAPMDDVPEAVRYPLWLIAAVVAAVGVAAGVTRFIRKRRKGA